LYRICFATPLARPILDPSFQGDFGGSEVRAVNFAKGLSCEGEFEVSMVLNSYRPEASRKFARIKGHFDRQPAPIPKTRDLKRDHTFYWNALKITIRKLQRSIQKKREKLTSVRPKAMPFLRDVPADLVCVFGVHHYAANVVATARKSDKRSLLFLASDTDLDERYATQDAARNDYRQLAHMCRFALLNADKIIAQTETQQRLLLERFGRESTVIRNPIDLRVPSDSAERPMHDRYVLWVGRADTFSKRADKCFQLATACPNVKFVVILNRRDESTLQRLFQQAPPNAEVIERVPFTGIDRYFRHATALINTSDAEGFPNAFLQAGKYGVPILSLNVDPDEMITRHGCGSFANGDLETMNRQLIRYWDEDESFRRASTSISTYIREYHELAARVQELRAEILDLMSIRYATRKAA